MRPASGPSSSPRPPAPPPPHRCRAAKGRFLYDFPMRPASGHSSSPRPLGLFGANLGRSMRVERESSLETRGPTGLPGYVWGLMAVALALGVASLLERPAGLGSGDVLLP